MTLFPPKSERNPATWAAVAAGHAWVGVALVALCLWAGWPGWAGPLAYLVAWEIGLQCVGAGWADAVTDAGFVAFGALIGTALAGGALGLAVAGAACVVLCIGFGVWRRL